MIVYEAEEVEKFLSKVIWKKSKKLKKQITRHNCLSILTQALQGAKEDMEINMDLDPIIKNEFCEGKKLFG